MQRKRGELGPIGDALADLDGPVKALREAPPQALHHFTQADQVNQLVGASETDPDLGFMARLLALCSLPRSNPGNRLQYKRVNGPYTLIMYSSDEYKLPFGNLPRLLLAWVCTEAVRRFWCRQPTGIGDNEIWRIVKRNGILYLPDVGSKTTSFFSAFAGISLQTELPGPGRDFR